MELYEFAGDMFPDYLKRGDAKRFIVTAALDFCQGVGLDVGCGRWPLPGAQPFDLIDGNRAEALPAGSFDYIFSSHCLEHVVDPICVLEHWKSRLVSGGCLFLYLPHPDMTYWRPQFCRKHLHIWMPDEMRVILEDLGFVNVLNSERDLAWSFAVVGYVP